MKIMSEKLYNYVYLITNLDNGKQYIGDHSTNNLEKDKYLGSGDLIIKAKIKYGKEKLKKEILEFFSTKLEAFNAQEKYINLYESNVSQGGYNISPKGGLCVKGCHNKETKEKISKSNTGKRRSNDTKSLMSKKAKGRQNNLKKLSDNEKRVIIYMHIMFNRGICEIESKTNINRDRIKRFLIKHNLYKGRIYSKETKEKLSKERKGNKRSLETKENMSNSLKGMVPWNKGNKNNFRGKSLTSLSK